MMLTEFDSFRLGDDIRRLLDDKPRGFRSEVLRATGISVGTFNRLLDSPIAVKQIDVILTACQYFNLDFESYVIRRKQDGDEQETTQGESAGVRG